MDAYIEAMLALPPSKQKNITSEIVCEMVGLDLFQKLDIELEFLIFKGHCQWVREANSQERLNQIPRAVYWLDVFGEHPIKAIAAPYEA